MKDASNFFFQFLQSHRAKQRIYYNPPTSWWRGLQSITKLWRPRKWKILEKEKKKLCKERKTVAGVYLTKGEEQGKGKGKNSEGMGHGHKSSGSSSKNNLSHLPKRNKIKILELSVACLRWLNLDSLLNHHLNIEERGVDMGAEDIN